MNPLSMIVADMRQKHLWPLAILLVIALVAIPIVLSKPSPTPVAEVTPPSLTPSAGVTGEVPAITAQVSPVRSKLHGTAHDPFTDDTSGQLARAKASIAAVVGKSDASSSSSPTRTTTTLAATASTQAAGTASTTSRTTGDKVSTAGGAGKSGSSSHKAKSHTPAPVNPSPTAVPGLTPTEVYDVSLSTTNAQGNIVAMNPIERLSALPRVGQSLLLELGVSENGRRVMFALAHGAAVSGPGRCSPSPANCQVLSMAPGQVEMFASNTTGDTVYEFLITGIHKRSLRDRAAALRARTARSATGANLFKTLSGSGLSLFSYKPSLGVIIEARRALVSAR